MAMISDEELRENFDYDAETGELRRKDGGGSWRGAGKDRRYLITSYRSKDYYAHRLVWQYHYGAPPPMIDHKDNNPRNNRVENLRPCSPAQNQYNSSRKVNNKSGYKGVVYDASCLKPWRARIVVDKKVVPLGQFATAEEAAAAYAAGAQKYAKEFARHA